ncbi:Cobalt-precorrin-2 C20-methyltransferase [Rubellimicrobium mesophilum DSM 19309]|uniref:Cobalt-precorrin-2 C20-methyltransferase n=1 Tax=Rubellimicrobium mesophilum DSM 19309 TaxID=442562 RepID=A0A017HWE1_9RHOB|nr:precorrin-2 C(20)-methyltransferase [Rubellimicrobium mesophilum]EYD78034.1 Cobalt-precorrin-2 C20-methyltransferase [Rubellimicrobium mesophilum DSM 19309]
MVAGRLIGVGVGPGAPDLLTLRAARAIEAARVLAYPTLAGAPSMARGIAAAHVGAGVEEIAIDVPMTPAREPAQRAYDEGAERIAGHLSAGRDVVCLCEGDPMFYGSFMYLQARLADRFAVEVVPGVTSVSAAAALARLPLGAREGRIAVLPGTLPDEALRAGIAAHETVAVMKLGRHFGRVRALVDSLGLTDRATLVVRATLDGEAVVPLSEAPEEAPYFSLLLIAKDTDPWL